MHIRLLLTRVYLVAALVICTLLYFAWIYPTLHVQSRINKALTGSSRRIIVFGDSFSDTGSYAIPAPPNELRPARNPAEGRRWTEVLCEEVLLFPCLLHPFSLVVWSSVLRVNAQLPKV
jgi:hypothetical protein